MSTPLDLDTTVAATLDAQDQAPAIGGQNECYRVILRRTDVPGAMAGNLLWVQDLLATLFPRGNFFEDDVLLYRMQSALNLDGNKIIGVGRDAADDTSLVTLGQLQQLIQENS